MPTIKELRQVCQNSEESPSWKTQSFEGRFNRIFSIYLTWIFIKLPFTPNQITIFGTLLYLFAASLFVFNVFIFNVIALVLIFISFLLDAVDGELARYRKMSKGGGVGGAYVEPVTHDIMYAFFFLPISIGATVTFNNNVFLILAAFIATISKLLFRLAEFRYDALIRFWAEQKGEKVGYKQNVKTPPTIFYFIFRNFFTGTGIFTLLIPAVLLNRLDLFLYFYALSFFLLWCYKMFRQQVRIRNKLKSSDF